MGSYGGQGPLIFSFSDVHTPRYLHLLVRSLSAMRINHEPCAILMAGDLIDKGRVGMMSQLLAAVRARLRGSRLLAVFGNEEYHHIRGELRRLYSDVTWLDDEYLVFECGETTIAVVGTTGALERPTKWQARNMPELYRVYRERPRRVAEMIDMARREAELVILMSHYALSRDTVAGEDPRIWPYLYSSAMERVVVEKKPHLAVHGHAHRGRPFASVSGVPIFNVALPLNGEIVRLNPLALQGP